MMWPFTFESFMGKERRRRYYFYQKNLYLRYPFKGIILKTNQNQSIMK
jgi:hypothetical protein